MGFSLPGWPGGDPDAIDKAATAWRTFAQDLKNAVTTADAVVQSSLAGWEGDSAKRFDQTWSQFVTSNKQLAAYAEQVDGALSKLSGSIRSAQHKYELAVSGLVTATIVGIGLAVVTFGIGGAIEASAAYATATGVVAGMLASLGMEITAALAVVDIGYDVVVGMTVGFETSIAQQETMSLVSDHKLTDVNWTNVGDAALEFGALNGMLSRSAWYLRILEGAGVNVALPNLATAMEGKKTPDMKELAISALLNGLGGLIAPRESDAEAGVEEVAEANGKIGDPEGTLSDDQLLAQLEADGFGGTEEDELLELLILVRESHAEDGGTTLVRTTSELRVVIRIPTYKNYLTAHPEQAVKVADTSASLDRAVSASGLSSSLKTALMKEVEPRKLLSHSYDSFVAALDLTKERVREIAETEHEKLSDEEIARIFSEELGR